jgi:hypothetical protein
LGREGGRRQNKIMTGRAQWKPPYICRVLKPVEPEGGRGAEREGERERARRRESGIWGRQWLKRAWLYE